MVYMAEKKWEREENQGGFISPVSKWVLEFTPGVGPEHSMLKDLWEKVYLWRKFSDQGKQIDAFYD